jgi:hypothetical protein
VFGTASGLPGVGGAIVNRGTMSLDASLVYNNGANGAPGGATSAGGIANFGSLVIQDSSPRCRKPRHR